MALVVKTTPRLMYLRERDPVVVLQKGGWAPRVGGPQGWVGPKAGLKIQKHDQCINWECDTLLSAIVWMWEC